MAQLFSTLVSEVDSFIGLTTTPADDPTTATVIVEPTSNSSTNSAEATSTALSIVSSTHKLTKSASTPTTSGDTSTITKSSLSSTNTISSSSSPPSSSNQTSASTISSSASATGTASTPANPVALPTSTSSPSSSDNGNHVSNVGVAVAAVFAALILCSVAYLLWKYLPAARRYRERKYQERSHRKGLSLEDEEGMHFDDPKQGLGLQRFSFHTATTYYPGQPHEPQDISHRPLTSVSEEHVVSPISTRSMESISQHTLPSALQPGPTSYLPYRDVRASQIGVAVPIRSSGSPDKGLPPLPSTG